MTEYVILNRFAYNEPTDEILIGGLGCNNLSESERDIYISDVLTHEFIHKILYNLFNTIVSSLFDIIGDSLRNINVLSKAFKYEPIRTWTKAINKDGIQYFYNKKGITTHLHNEADIICNKRVA